ncbi:hypothetical protein F3Y22_tig00111783pilonHSYRG00132 [Hibiscus syriacus]|uniref:Uncharacterized protein n=1 Tax=Hibiscus syriacus TaxID=106335 RepID=A0A6A2YD09_HIBSY|nr:hypothetical protein F3Y22_tig00111783pilonHSYRG00132 [Hibiscus syriacus]
MEEVFKSLQGMTYISDPNASDSITNYTKKSAAASTDTAVPIAFTAANKRSFKGNGGSGGTMRYRGVRCRPWGRYLLRYETPSPRNGVGSGLLTPPRRLHAPTTVQLELCVGSRLEPISSTRRRSLTRRAIISFHLLPSRSSHSHPAGTLTASVISLANLLTGHRWQTNIPVTSPLGLLLKETLLRTCATDSVSDSFTGTTMTHTPKETVDDMEFFPQKPSDSGLFQEIIQGFIPKKSGELKVTTNCTQHSIAVPVESFSGVTGSESVPYANEVPTKYLQVGQDFLLDDIFQYPDFMGALAARVQNA